MITAAQLRAARVLLGIDQRQLAELSRLSVPTVQRMEASETMVRGNVDSLVKVVQALEDMGIELIGEGTISTDQDEFGAMPDKDWTTLYFNRSIPAHYHYVMYVSHFDNGTWSVPETLPFSGEYRDSDPVLSTDGHTLYFVSDRPAEGLEPHRFHAWSADRTASGWTNLHPLRGPVNEKGNTEFVSFAANGNLYFTSDRSGSSFDVYRSRLVNAQYQPAENVGPAVNDGRYTIEAFVAPDESFILLGNGWER